MSWWQAILLGIVQGLTEFLPVSSSGHLMIFREFLGVDGEGFLDFTVMVHLGTVISTLVVFWEPVWKLLKGLFIFIHQLAAVLLIHIVGAGIKRCPDKAPQSVNAGKGDP